MIIEIILFILLVLASLWAVMRGTLVKAAIALAVSSILTSILIFRLSSPIAAVFELSVCAGLITVIFMSTISLTKPLTYAEKLEKQKLRLKKFWMLPLLVLVSAVILVFLAPGIGEITRYPDFIYGDIRTVLWKLRQTDIFGQLAVLLLGAFGITVLFKNKAGQ